MLEICHLFVFVEPDPPGVPGLAVNFRRAHPGQGTANLCHVFDNAYLELLWATDAAELASPAVAPTALAARADWRRTGACPFGIGLRGEGAMPFPTWDYRAPFLPPGMALPVAEESHDPRRPFLFRSPGTARPDAWTDGRAGRRQRDAGLAEIAGVHLAGPCQGGGDGMGPALAVLAAAGLISLEMAPVWSMTLALSRSGAGPAVTLRLP